ncbi:MAG: zinc-dependent metalloprotease [Planctomycetales bacterium]|nr:zinc-dependent metalloprotease [Planctomycetales bacterium]
MTVSRCLCLSLLMLLAAAPLRGQDQGPASRALAPAADNLVSLPVTGLGREYLISISVIPQAGAPTSSGLSGRVVSFQRYGDVLDMYESPTGLVTTKDLPAKRLLASFPIVKDEKDQITFDFNGGMRRLFTSGWIGSDSFSSRELETVLEVPQARVFSVKLDGERLAIRQVVQARSREFSRDVEQRLEVRYFVEPYAPGKFKSKENDNQSQRYVRYFQTNATLELNSGRPVSKIARFDISEPVTFYYSANTPKEYEEAVRSGILYWNRAFGKEVLRCEKAPNGVTAPAPEHNIVQWVPWDEAGFAYADALLDPRTGKTMHGQAYMTTVFAISGVARARSLLRRLRAAEKKEAEKKDDDKDDDKDGDDDDDKKLASRLLGLPMFHPAVSCQSNVSEFTAQYAAGLESMLLLADEKEGDKKGASDEAILRASQDYVCEVVAHEVGHVLGLRHNFAGSLAGNISPKELDEWFNKYVKDEELPDMKDRVTTSSVMEYTHFQSAVFSGRKIRNTDEVFPHDKAAIQWGYFGDTAAVKDKLLFGTDQDVGVYSDVQRFDYGADPLVAAFSDLSKRVNGLPARVIEDFISAKAPRDPRDAIPLSQVNLQVGFEVSGIVSDYRSMFRWFRASSRSLKVERDFEYIGTLNEEERLKAHWKRLNEQVTAAGGIDRIGFSFLPLPLTLDLKPEVKDLSPADKFDAAKMTEKLGELLESDAYKKFVGADGKEHEFTDDDRKLIKERAEEFFKEVENELVERIFQTWGSLTRDLGVEVEGRVSDDDIVAKFEKQVIAAAKHVITARDEKDGERIRGKVDKAYVEVVDFKYDLETRLMAARALADSAGSYSAWAKEPRGELNKALKAMIDASLNINNFKEFSDAKLSRPLRNWYLDQQQVLRALPN